MEEERKAGKDNRTKETNRESVCVCARARNYITHRVCNEGYYLL